MQPPLRTVRLDLHPTAPADLDALWALWTHPDVRRYLWDDRAITRDEAAATLGDCAALAPRGLGLWTLRPRGPDVHPPLGCAGLLPATTAAEYEPRLAGLVEPLVALDPRAWGQGYAGEALAALVAHARGPLGLGRLAGITDVPNAASNRMLRRAGFAVLGECEGPRHRMRTYVHEGAPAGTA